MNDQLVQAFHAFSEFSPGNQSEIRLFFAPGRVNLIGEHTDYNGGYVLPAALELGTWAFVRPRTDNILRFASTNFPEVIEVPTNSVVFHQEHGFANYPLGVIREYQKLGSEIAGFDILFHGTLPTGAGLSSSASIEVVTAALLNAYSEAGLDRDELALLAQRAENQFVGVQCGIMDQFAVALGKRQEALFLNCGNLNYRLVPVNFSGMRIVITNSNKPRGLVDSKYNERRKECELALDLLRQQGVAIQSLSEMSPEQWRGAKGLVKDAVLRRRVEHIVSENHRVQRAVEALDVGDVTAFGQLMNESHYSLRDNYEVTGPELDRLAEAAWSAPGCIGSRMTGAGFGGCTVSLVAESSLGDFQESVRKAYAENIGYEPSFYVTDIGGGVREDADVLGSLFTN